MKNSANNFTTFNYRIAFTASFFLYASALLAQHSDLVDSSQTQVLADTQKSYFISDVSRKNMRWAKGAISYLPTSLGL